MFSLCGKTTTTTTTNHEALRGQKSCPRYSGPWGEVPLALELRLHDSHSRPLSAISEDT